MNEVTLCNYSNHSVVKLIFYGVPFFDTHHAPYKSKHHYWTGLLLLVRMAVLTMTSANPDTKSLFIGCAVTFIFRLSLNAGGVYKKRYPTVLESSFLLYLSLLSLFMSLFRQTDNIQRAAVGTSIAVTFATFIGIVALHLVLEGSLMGTDETKTTETSCSSKSR